MVWSVIGGCVPVPHDFHTLVTSSNGRTMDFPLIYDKVQPKFKRSYLNSIKL